MTHIDNFECMCGSRGFLIKRGLNGSATAMCSGCLYTWPLDKQGNISLPPAEIHCVPKEPIMETTSLLDMFFDESVSHAGNEIEP